MEDVHTPLYKHANASRNQQVVFFIFNANQYT